MSDKVPNIQPIKLKEYQTQQSKYDMFQEFHLDLLYQVHQVVVKLLLPNMILDIYKNCFSRIYIFSASIDVDSTWLPVKKYIEDGNEGISQKGRTNIFFKSL